MTSTRPTWEPMHDLQLRTLHSQELSVRGIGEQMGFSRSTISRHGKRLGLVFDQKQTKAATKAVQVTAKARRAILELQLLEDAERLRAQMWEPHEYVDHGGKDFIMVTWTRTEPVPTDKLKLMQAAAAAIDRSVKIAQLDSDTGATGAISLLENLAKSLGVTGPEVEQ